MLTGSDWESDAVQSQETLIAAVAARNGLTAAALLSSLLKSWSLVRRSTGSWAGDNCGDDGGEDSEDLHGNHFDCWVLKIRS
jgi:hypothetical protein